MNLDPTLLLVCGSLVTFGIWVLRFAFLQKATAREMRGAVMRRLARLMGTRFWHNENPFQDEIAEGLGIHPASIVSNLQWVNPEADMFSFQEVRRGGRRSTYYKTWLGYRFGKITFPKFDLMSKGMVSSLFHGWGRRISLVGQFAFSKRFLLWGDDSPLITQFFSPDRCAAISDLPWPTAFIIKARGHWLFVSRERWLEPRLESDFHADVVNEFNELILLCNETAPIARALAGSNPIKDLPKYENLAPLKSRNGARPWWDAVALWATGFGLVISLLLIAIYSGEIWVRFDQTFLGTEPRRYVFAVCFIVAL
jgi:hypothetical protein